MRIVKTLLLGALLPLSVFAQDLSVTPDKTVWYTEPAKDWNTQALHIGNGYMGASFYGGITEEWLDIAEETFWTGRPGETIRLGNGDLPGGKNIISEIRSHILKGNYAEADKMTARYLTCDMKGYGYFSNVGRLSFKFKNQTDSVTHYRRGLELGDGFGFVEYTCGDTQFRRSYFCNYPNKVMVIRFTANRPEQLTFDIEHAFTHKLLNEEFTNKKEWIVQGEIADNNMKYTVRMWIDTDGGRVDFKDHKLSVNKANEVKLYYTIDTEYLCGVPDYKGVNPDKTTADIMTTVRKIGYSELWKNHMADYQRLFKRVEFDLTGDKELEQLPTDQRIMQLKKGITDDSKLKALWFNFGRYMIISASRANTLPSNLQGVWNAAERAAWNGNYQSNINLQEMYWSCGATRLEECEMAYINWIKGLVPSGRKTAKAYYGTQGWVSNATGDIWGYTCPGSDILWGLYPCGAAWHCRHLWEHYEYTQDKAYLKEVYPIMKEAAQFWLENLVEKEGYLMVIPSISAEHGIQVDKGAFVPYTTVNGESGNKIYTVPAFQDITMVKNLFSDVCKAMKVLGTDEQMYQQIQRTMDRMKPFKIGKYGQLQEWIEDVDNPRDHHRHIAHLYGMYPGNLISVQKTPDLAEAVRNSLLLRGYGTFGDRWPHAGGNWSTIWRTALWSRLGDGNRAIDAFNTMIRNSGYENMGSNQSGYFMVDAIMATSGVFAEMLVQTIDDNIYLLPALPAEWPEGQIKGIQLRGGYLVDMKWTHGVPDSVTVYVPKGKKNPFVFWKQKEFSNVHFKTVSLK